MTEEQFHAAASDPYSWSKPVQMRQFGSNVGLMVGMSLTDRNLRRILEAMKKLPDLCPQYAVLKKEQRELTDDMLQRIKVTAECYGHHRKVEGREQEDIRSIFRQLDRKMTMRVLEKLGVSVIWNNDFDEIPQLFDEIAGGT